MSAGLKDPRGGLTPAGRDWFRRTQGAHLQPGVKKSRARMSPQDMHRKGSWAVRFYGRKGVLPPLRKANGEPTRYALTAAAWGEAVPKTVAAARRIAAEGRRLLAAYARTRQPAGGAKKTAGARKRKSTRAAAPSRKVRVKRTARRKTRARVAGPGDL